jgi:fatty-acyl-CoA synthase
MTMPVSRGLGLLVREQAARFGTHPAVIGGGETISYAALAERAARIAGFLRARGIRRGDRIGLLMNNRPEWIETFFGAMWAGAVIVAFSTWSKRDELGYLIADSDIRLLVALDRFGDQNFSRDLRAIAAPPIVLLGRDRDRDWIDWHAMLETSPVEPLSAAPEDDAIIIYTSGSSSRPKSVPLAHGGIVENGFNIGERQGYSANDRVLLAPPLFWSYGSANAMSAVLTHGATLVLQPRFDAGEALDLIEHHRCTALYTLPSITAALVSHPAFRSRRTASLRTGLTIGTDQDVVTAAEVLGAREICNVYGQTETYGNCCVTPHDWLLERRAACQGPPLPGVTIRIVDETTGDSLPPGKPGLIEVKGHVMPGYVGASAGQTAAALTADGYFRTGDMGELTGAGELRFIGRTTEMIKKGGINIAPAELEDVLMRHPAVALAGVVGVPDAVQGERIAAFVVVKPGNSVTEADLVAHCRELASRYKVPDFVSLRDALPLTATGKLMRRDLKILAARLTNESR